MAAVYPLTLEAMLKGDVDLDGTVKVLAVTSGYVYSAAHNFLDDVGAGTRLGTAATFTGKTFTDGVFLADAITYTGVSAGQVIAGLVGYLDTGVEATSRLLFFEDKNADGSPVGFTADGSGIPISWPSGRIFTI